MYDFIFFFHVTFYSLGSVAGSTSNNYCLYMINLKPSCSLLSQQKERKGGGGGKDGEKRRRDGGGEFRSVQFVGFLPFF